MVNASARESAEWVTITAMATIIGAVGPDTMARVPPNIAAQTAIAIAAYNPACAPTPDATPKAIDKGRAMIAAVIPPKMSPLSKPMLYFTSFFFYAFLLRSRQSETIQQFTIY